MNTLWKLIKRFLGFPDAPTPEQQTERLILMRESRDCHIPAVAVACGTALGRRVSYEESSSALKHWNLPFFLESPIMSNPLNLCRGIKALGCKANDKIKISELLKGELAPGAIICLVHNPAGQIAGTLQSHWVVWFGRDENNVHLFHWGQKQDLRSYSEAEVVDMLTAGWPNCIIEVSK
jgi:hypothetical protein